jgi:hypothetical protein
VNDLPLFMVEKERRLVLERKKLIVRRDTLFELLRLARATKKKENVTESVSICGLSLLLLRCGSTIRLCLSL